MMRENMGLHRGKRLDNGEWVEGYLIITGGYLLKTNDFAYIVYPDCFPDDLFYSLGNIICAVDPDTVGQFTGLPDKNGKRIFEGDVVRYGNRTGHVIYGNGCFCVQDSTTQNRPAIDLVMYQWDVTVIGTIHDNPELLEVTHNE